MTEKRYNLYKITYQGIIFEEVDNTDVKVLVDIKILGMGKHIYANEEYDREEIEDYITDEEFEG